MVIRAGDRVSTVIGMDESLVDVFVTLSPAFERLRRPAMRRVMARLVTVEQAARMAGVDVHELVARLNAHVAAGDDSAAADTSAGAAVRSGAPEPAEAGAAASLPSGPAPVQGGAGIPRDLAAIPEAWRVELDVRAELRAGREPFSLIMAARRQVPAGGALAVRAIFEPVPLYAVMRKQGLTHFTERLAEEDWRVWFYAPDEHETPERHADDGAPTRTASSDVDVTTDSQGDDVVVLDVRTLEPPEPMMRTLAALEELPATGTLVQLNVRIPQFLLPLLEERGFTYEVREQEPGLVRVFIRHRAA